MAPLKPPPAGLVAVEKAGSHGGLQGPGGLLAFLATAGEEAFLCPRLSGSHKTHPVEIPRQGELGGGYRFDGRDPSVGAGLVSTLSWGEAALSRSSASCSQVRAISSNCSRGGPSGICLARTRQS